MDRREDMRLSVSVCWIRAGAAKKTKYTLEENHSNYLAPNPASVQYFETEDDKMKEFNFQDDIYGDDGCDALTLIFF